MIERSPNSPAWKRHLTATLCGAAGAVLTTFAAAPSCAGAQAAPAPIGHWATQGKIEELVVYSNATCGFFYRGQVRVSGRCSWMASSRGGILDITYSMPLAPGHVRFSVVWVNQSAITVNGDPMRRVG